jgi:5-methylcytosine-specific restriction endonuclease McrA
MIKKIVTRITTHVKVQHVIVGTHTSGSYADYLLLKETYKEKDPVPKKPKKVGRFKQMLFNTKFLQFMIKEHTDLHCEYCGKENLKLYHWKYDTVTASSYSNMATVDHFLPKSLYPELAKDYDNLKVCCHKCNQKKKDDIWDESTLKFPY